MRRLAVLATTAGLALAGCGGDDEKKKDAGGDRGYADPSAEVRSVLEGYFAALADGDGDKACSYLSKAGIEKIEQAGGSDCGKVVGAGVEQTGTTPYEKVEISRIEVDGDSASSHYVLSVQGQDVEADQKLVKEDGEWRLEANAPPGG